MTTTNFRTCQICNEDGESPTFGPDGCCLQHPEAKVSLPVTYYWEETNRKPPAGLMAEVVCRTGLFYNPWEDPNLAYAWVNFNFDPAGGYALVSQRGAGPAREYFQFDTRWVPSYRTQTREPLMIPVCGRCELDGVPQNVTPQCGCAIHGWDWITQPVVYDWGKTTRPNGLLKIVQKYGLFVRHWELGPGGHELMPSVIKLG